MTTPELIQFVKNDLASGVTREVIANKLKMQGWNEDDTFEVFNIVNKENSINSNNSQTTELNKFINIPKVSQMDSSPLQPIETMQTLINQSNFSSVNTSGNIGQKKSSKIYIIMGILVMMVCLIFLAYSLGYLSFKPKDIQQSVINNNESTTSENKQTIPDTNNSNPIIDNSLNNSDVTTTTQDSTQESTQIQAVQGQVDSPDLSNSISSNPQPSKENLDDSSKQSILATMNSQAEAYYQFSNNSYKGFCTSKLENGAYQLAITLPKNSVYKCHDSVGEWAAWVKLSNGEYWCNDVNNFSNTTSLSPVGTSCLK